jgi:hypothetical protein
VHRHIAVTAADSHLDGYTTAETAIVMVAKRCKKSDCSCEQSD